MDEQDDQEESVDDTDSIDIRAPKEPEVNPDVYADVTAIVSRGFLTVTADLGPTTFVFKSLNHHEFDMVRLLSGFSSNTRSLPPRFWDLFLAHMVLFVDGQNVLLERSRHLAKLAGMFRDLPNAARQRLIRQLSELNRKASQATLLVEAYATESYSRWRWAQVHGLDLSAPAATGYDGTDKLGLSYAQLTWRAVNYYEDMRARQDAEWENAKFIGGCFAGKGIQKVYNRDNDRRQKERQERWNRKDQLLRHVLFGDPMEADKRYGGAQVVMVASTVEELAAQVEQSLKGEKDWHDQVIQEYEEGIRTGNRQRQEQLADLVETHKGEMGDQQLTGTTKLAGLTTKEVEEIIRQQRRREAEALMAQEEKPPLLDEKMSNVMDRWGLTDAGLPTTDRSPQTAIPLTPRRTTGKPWKG